MIDFFTSAEEQIFFPWKELWKWATGAMCAVSRALLLSSNRRIRMDEPKLNQKLSSPMLPFQIFSSFFSSAIWLLVSEVWRECVPVAAAMEGTDRAGRRLVLSAFPGSFRDRCWRTLIMASFSIIFAWRFFILPKYECSAYRSGNSVYAGSCPHPGAAALLFCPLQFWATRTRALLPVPLRITMHLETGHVSGH